MNAIPKSNRGAGRSTVLIVLAGSTFSVCTAVASAREPHINYVYPAGGQAGMAVEATVGGEALNDISEARVTGSPDKSEGKVLIIVKKAEPGVRARVVLTGAIAEIACSRSSAGGSRIWAALCYCVIKQSTDPCFCNTLAKFRNHEGL